MRNYIQPGDTLTVPAPAGGILSGGVYISGFCIGIATTAAAAGVPVAIKVLGVFELPKVSAQAWTIGQAVYWDGTNLNATTTAGGNTLLGYAAEAAANPSSVGRVQLVRRAA